ncbi:hypothetical protein HQ393_04900 [Chitinibacter bivalviorum]|uniref:Uncharacterized protein n=1 Tax=Chitinibacter bivalviorum TaxID=2739434 RepID=A0A7H9BJB5_9NEIS|nr:hypothetical protein [Chitinibacter bivalviorum]QLG87644.1 hypothetical protein HQ393_04900 [Chitinibacter bivalviorum]
MGKLFGLKAPSTITQVNAPPDYVKPYLVNQLQQAQNVYNRPYEQYSGQRVAGFTPTQTQYQNAVQARQGQQVATNPYEGQQATVGTNQYMGQTTPVYSNRYLGQNNPYLQDQINYAQGDVTRNYSSTIKPGLDAAAVRAGAFGSSGWNQQQNDANRTLAESLGRVSSDMRMQDYGQQINMAEADANRRTNVAQTDLARNASLADSDISRRLGAWQTDAARNAGLADSRLGRQQQFDLQNLAMLNDVGQQQQQLAQTAMNQSYQDWYQQYMEPERRLGVLQGTVGTNYGNTSSSPNPNQSSRAANVFGGAMSGFGMFGPIGALGGGLLGLL